MNDEQIKAEGLVANAQEMFKNGRDVEDIIQLFREAGVSKRIAIRLLVQTGEYSRREAKRIVHYSKAYEAQREVDEALKDSLFDSLESMDAHGLRNEK